MRHAVHWAAALLAGSLACAPCAAEEPAVSWPELPLTAFAPTRTVTPDASHLDEVPAVEPRPRARVESTFVRRHLVPRLSKQFREVAPIYTSEWDDLPFRQSLMGDWLEQSAEYRAGRGFEKAARDFLLETSGVAEWIESIRFGRDGFGEAGAGSHVDGGLRFSHGQPNVELRFRGDVGTFRLGVTTDGSAGFEFRPQSWIEARVFAGYDADRSRYRLEYRYAF